MFALSSFIWQQLLNKLFKVNAKNLSRMHTASPVLVGNIFQQSLPQPVQAFGPVLVPHHPCIYDFIQQHVSSDLEDVNVENDAILGSDNTPRRLRIQGRGIPMRKDPIQTLDFMTYKSYLIKSWEQDPSQQKGSSFIDFLVSKSGSDPGNASRPVGLVDVVKLVLTNTFPSVGMGPTLGWPPSLTPSFKSTKFPSFPSSKEFWVVTCKPWPVVPSFYSSTSTYKSTDLFLTSPSGPSRFWSFLTPSWRVTSCLKQAPKSTAKGCWRKFWIPSWAKASFLPIQPSGKSVTGRLSLRSTSNG
jgi:hypothetical protein